MAIEGNLETFNLPEILQMISAQNKTGILTVQGDADIVAVSFKDGQVVGADALNQTVEEGLGQVLASQGMVSPADFSSVIGDHERTGKRLLDLLTERGLLDRSQLLEALRLQTYQLLLQLLRWEEGEFKFYSGDEVAFEEGFYAISVEELLIRSVSDLGEGQGTQLPELGAIYRQTGGGHAIKVIGRDGDAPLPGDTAVWLDGEEKLLWDELDGTRSAGELAGATKLGEYKVLFALYRLLSAGAVKPVASAPAAAAPPPPTLAPSPTPASPVPSTWIEGAAAPPPPASEAPPSVAPSPRAAPPGAPIRASAPVLSLEMPLEEELAVHERPRAGRRGLDLSGLAALVPPVIAGLCGALLLWVPFSSGLGDDLLLPFPWSAAAGETLRTARLQSHYQRIDRNARTYFLLEGHYPDTLSELVDLRLLGSEDLRDPAGRLLAYSSDDVSYLLQPVEGEVPSDEPPIREAITGDFLLDPEALDLPEERAPLVLLD